MQKNLFLILIPAFVFVSCKKRQFNNDAKTTVATDQNAFLMSLHNRFNEAPVMTMSRYNSLVNGRQFKCSYYRTERDEPFESGVLKAQTYAFSDALANGILTMKIFNSNWKGTENEGNYFDLKGSLMNGVAAFARTDIDSYKTEFVKVENDGTVIAELVDSRSGMGTSYLGEDYKNYYFVNYKNQSYSEITGKFDMYVIKICTPKP